MATKRKEPEAVPVEVVEPAEFTIMRFEPGGIIEANFEAVKARIAEMIAIYEGVQVTPEYLPQAKKDRAWLNSLVTSVDQKRKDIKARYMESLVAFEAEVKDTLAPVREASAAIDTQVKALEEAERIAKRGELVKHYADYAGALTDAVPFERIEDPSWALKSTSLMAAFKAIEDRADGIAKDDAALDSLGLEFIIDAKAEYFATLDMSRAIARNAEMIARREKALAAEAAKAEAAAYRAETAAPEPIPEPVAASPIIEAIAEPAEVARTWQFTVTCTRTQLDGALAALKALDIPGTVK